MISYKTIVVDSDKTGQRYWKDIITYRELLGFLIWRDVLIRYKQTAIGISWVLIKPIITMVVFTVFFGKIVKVPTDGIPYPILVAIGTLPWQYFSSAIVEISNSLLNSSNLISKVFFPKIFIPFSSATVCFIDFLISFSILIVLIIYYNIGLTYNIIYLPFMCLLMFFSAFGLGLFFSAINVKFRDFKFVVPFIAQLSLYISPVGYNSAIIPPNLKIIYNLNPLVGIIEGFRWIIIPKNDFPIDSVLISIVMISVTTFLGFIYFRKRDTHFADYI